MTFEEWWKSKKTLIETVVNNNKSHIDLIVFIKSIMNIAWDTSQPKWTYCKDGMPKNGQFIIAIIKNTYDNAYYSLVGWYSSSDFEKEKYISAYISGEAMMIDDNGLNCSFIAWMPLPEAPAEINSGFNKQGANI